MLSIKTAFSFSLFMCFFLLFAGESYSNCNKELREHAACIQKCKKNNEDAFISPGGHIFFEDRGWVGCAEKECGISKECL